MKKWLVASALLCLLAGSLSSTTLHESYEPGPGPMSPTVVYEPGPGPMIVKQSAICNS